MVCARRNRGSENRSGESDLGREAAQKDISPRASYAGILRKAVCQQDEHFGNLGRRRAKPFGLLEHLRAHVAQRFARQRLARRAVGLWKKKGEAIPVVNATRRA